MERQSFIDWMKTFGMLLIVTGHVIGDPFNVFNRITQPLYTKQLGVSFFIFIIGWGLANEARTGARVLFNRVFPVYFYGLLCAVFLSGIFYFLKGDINESNYLPFIFGLNVFFNHFPANSTTWYIGTYLHILLFWFFFMRSREIKKRHLVFSFLCENMVRCLLISWNKEMIAYMLLPNWLTVFLLGSYLHKKRDAVLNSKVFVLISIWVAIVLFWSSSFNLLSFDRSFPFREPSWEQQIIALPLRSFMISCLYLANTLLVFEVFRRLPSFRVVSFFARNTLIIFIIHIPIIFELSGYFYETFGFLGELKRLALIVVLFVGLALFSEWVQTIINLKLLREKAWNAVMRLHNTVKDSRS